MDYRKDNKIPRGKGGKTPRQFKLHNVIPQLKAPAVNIMLFSCKFQINF